MNPFVGTPVVSKVVPGEGSKLGVVRGLGEPAYHAGPGVSHSDIKLLLQSPKHFAHRPDEIDEGPKTERDDGDKRIGTATHCAALEGPDEFERRYVIAPKSAGNHRGKTPWLRFAESVEGGRIPLTHYEGAAVVRMCGALMSHPEVAELLRRPGVSESSGYWIDPATGAYLKCRPDRACEAGSGYLLLDLKTTDDARPDAFLRTMRSFRYHGQNAHYCDGFAIASRCPIVGPLTYIVVERDYPHDVIAYTLDDEFVRRAREVNRRALDDLMRCVRSGEWPGFSNSVIALSMPRYWDDFDV